MLRRISASSAPSPVAKRAYSSTSPAGRTSASSYSASPISKSGSAGLAAGRAPPERCGPCRCVQPTLALLPHRGGDLLDLRWRHLRDTSAATAPRCAAASDCGKSPALVAEVGVRRLQVHRESDSGARSGCPSACSCCCKRVAIGACARRRCGRRAGGPATCSRRLDRR